MLILPDQFAALYLLAAAFSAREQRLHFAVLEDSIIAIVRTRVRGNAERRCERPRFGLPAGTRPTPVSFLDYACDGPVHRRRFARHALVAQQNFIGSTNLPVIASVLW